MTNKLRVEIFNYTTQTWIDVTQDVQAIVASQGLEQQLGQASPRGNVAPAQGTGQIVLRNDASSQFGSGGYNPSISGNIWPRNPVRVRANGNSLGYCLQAYVTGSPDAASFNQTVTAASTTGDVWLLTWDARAIDARYNQDYIQIVMDGGEISNWSLYTYTNKWVTYTFSYTVIGAGHTAVQPHWIAHYAPGTNASTIEYRNISIQKNGGANQIVNGNFATGQVSPFWGPVNVSPTLNWTLGDSTLGVLGSTTRLSGTASSTCNLTVVPDTWIAFAGQIDKVEPHMHKNAGDLLCVLTVTGLGKLMRVRSVNLPAQVNQRADQILTTLYNLFQPGKFPGALFDTGFATFAFAFDGYIYGQTKVIDAARDAAMSENGRTWIDRDGTWRFSNRQALLNAVTKPVKLTVTDGMAYVGHLWTEGDMVTNDISITTIPRLVGTTPVQLATLTAAVPIPPTPTGTAPQPVTMTFVDATGKTIGGAAVNPPVYAINTKANGSGADMTTQTSQVVLQSQQVSASQAVYNFVNNTPQTFYLVSLTVSGIPVTQNNPITAVSTDAASIARYEDTTFKKVLPFGSDPGFAKTLADYYLTRYKDPFLEVDYIQIDNKETLNGVDLFSLELFDIVSVSDVQAGLSAQLYAIVAIDYTLTVLTAGIQTSIKFTLERMDSTTYWILNDATYGVLGTTTRLGI